MKLIMIGNTEYSLLLRKYVEDAGDRVEAFSVDSKYISDKMLEGIPVLPIEELMDKYPPSVYKLVLGIGYRGLSAVRKDIYFRCKEYGYSFFNYIHPSAVIDGSVLMGEGNVLFENTVIQKNAILGDGNLFFSNSAVMHDNRVGSFVTFGAGAISNGFVRIGDCCFLGSNSTLRDKIELGDNVIIGAGVYVNRDCDMNMTVVPAWPEYMPDSSKSFAYKL